MPDETYLENNLGSITVKRPLHKRRRSKNQLLLVLLSDLLYFLYHNILYLGTYEVLYYG